LNAKTRTVDSITDTRGAPAETQNSFGFFMLCGAHIPMQTVKHSFKCHSCGFKNFFLYNFYSYNFLKKKASLKKVGLARLVGFRYCLIKIMIYIIKNLYKIFGSCVIAVAFQNVFYLKMY
jgi:hypothetical protein